ncbi:hypothetical protein CUT44_12360 [Streptomyces carminius]|uniref:DUF4175 domain-containing protein n=1 Tax=Streptomyces carminius TaxID=2665496 RepID=A0A2M8LZT4_9ACTN|nr:hypothetical protein [Streptomyces carminius]PJE97467.1 hypothetical protein CUT44_12360 [Streptomyces carminius]
MLLLAELLSAFLPTEVRGGRAYVLHALLMSVIAALVLVFFWRVFGGSWAAGLPWAAGLAAGVAAGYAVAWPVVRRRWTRPR